MDRSEKFSKSKADKRKRTPSSIKPSSSDIGLQRPSSLQKNGRDKSTQYSFDDISSFDTDVEDETSSKDFPTHQCTSAENSDNSSEDSDDHSEILDDADIPICTKIYKALKVEYELLLLISKSYRGKLSLICSQESGYFEQATTDASTDSFVSSNEPSMNVQVGNSSVSSDAVQLSGANYFPPEIRNRTSSWDFVNLLSNLSESSDTQDIDHVAMSLIDSLSETLQDMNNLLKDMDEGPFWRRSDRDSQEAFHSIRRDINGSFKRNISSKLPDVKLRLRSLTYWLKKVVLFTRKVEGHRDIMNSMYSVRDMMNIFLKYEGLGEISIILEGVPDSLILRHDAEFVLELKQQVASIIKSLMCIKSNIERLQQTDLLASDF